MNHANPNRRDFLKTTLAGSAVTVGASAFSGRLLAAQDADASARESCNRIAGARFDLSGPVRNYLNGVTSQWLLVAPASNPAMLEMFRDRDRQPLRNLVPWAGEFAGKYLVSAVEIGRVTGDENLRQSITKFVKRLVSLQASDGYLGPWPADSHLTGKAPNTGDHGGDTWDAWGHYHVMLGLLFWYDETQDQDALQCAKRIGDLFCQKFATKRLVEIGSTEMNLAPVHSFGLLYERTNEKRYLDQALKIVDQFSAKSDDGKPLAGDYLNQALAGTEFYQLPKPRWESLHPIMGMAELYRITGDQRFRRAFESIWWSIVKLDRHNNGGFSSGEQAQGNPYHQGAIETCCTIAWTAMSVEMLRLTQNSIVADELELSLLNSVLGLHSPTGRWVTYNTPMDGVRKASAHDIVFQARAGSPELNCCSVNGARGLGMISDWAVMTSGDDLILNWFGPSTITVPMPGGNSVKLVQATDYPKGNRVVLTIAPAKDSQFTLKLRIPNWSRSTRVRVNQRNVENVESGRYLALDRMWQNGDTVEIEFDFNFRFWTGEKECAGKVSVYRGPTLLTYDRRFNKMDPDQVPPLNATDLANGKLVEFDGWLSPILLMAFTATDGRAVRLCDFASAGIGGSPYRSWLHVNGTTPAAFSRANPLRLTSA